MKDVFAFATNYICELSDKIAHDDVRRGSDSGLPEQEPGGKSGRDKE